MEWQIYDYEEVDSTNTCAENFSVGSVIVAKRQRAGKGRVGRAWQSLDGNLFMSVVLPSYENETPLLAFVCAVALADALQPFPVRLKWPNDVLLDGGKLAGILLERKQNGVIAGIGVNLVAAPTGGDMLYPTASLNGAVGKEELIEKFLNMLTYHLNLFETSGFEAIRQKWLKVAVGVGQMIKVNLPNETVVGIFEALTPQGAISLKTKDGACRHITAGDVFMINEKEDK